jgi:hypothetical protein
MPASLLPGLVGFLLSADLTTPLARAAISPGDATMTFVVFGIGIGVLFGVATGLVCALLRVRHPVLILLPLGALLTAGTALSGMVLHAHPGVIAIAVFGSVAASQLAYVAVSLTHYLIRYRL